MSNITNGHSNPVSMVKRKVFNERKLKWDRQQRRRLSKMLDV